MSQKKERKPHGSHIWPFVIEGSGSLWWDNKLTALGPRRCARGGGDRKGVDRVQEVLPYILPPGWELCCTISEHSHHIHPGNCSSWPPIRKITTVTVSLLTWLYVFHCPLQLSHNHKGAWNASLHTLYRVIQWIINTCLIKQWLFGWQIGKHTLDYKTIQNSH